MRKACEIYSYFRKMDKKYLTLLLAFRNMNGERILLSRVGGGTGPMKPSNLHDFTACEGANLKARKFLGR